MAVKGCYANAVAALAAQPGRDSPGRSTPGKILPGRNTQAARLGNSLSTIASRANRFVAFASPLASLHSPSVISVNVGHHNGKQR